MKIERIQILNYKSYVDSGFVPFGQGATILVGQNNAGKTALLETLSVQEFQSKPHRSPRARADELPNLDPTSRVNFDITLSGGELLQRLLGTGRTFDLSTNGPEGVARNIIASMFDSHELRFYLQFADRAWSSRTSPPFGPERPPFNAHIKIGPSLDRRNWRVIEIASGSSDSLGTLVGTFLAECIYVFRAERLNVGQCGMDGSHVLATNAQNLASVLLQLGAKPDAQHQYRDYIREIFPTIYDVRSAPIQNSVAQISVINRDGSKAGWNEGIRVPLNDSGTGISQVLAILYVVLTAESPQIIVIDEPNSFLHPGAARKLIDILRRFPHQYIISTHSAEIINAGNPDVVNLIRWSANASEVKTLDRANTDNQRHFLDELGVRLSDVFGADNVLWVEGLTEERCFPMVLTHLGISSAGITIRSLIATGDFESKRVRPELVLQIYERLSRGTALVPPALGISLDQEGRTAADMEGLRSRSCGLVKFLPRRTYENYLLHPAGIHSVLIAAIEGDEKPSLAEIEAWFRDHKFDSRYYDRREDAGPTDEDWIDGVNAPKLLKELFTQLSKTTVAYTKPHHPIELTRWLLQNNPEFLKGLLEYVSGLVRQ